MNLDTPLRHISGIGFLQGQRLAQLNLITVFDLLNHFPFRYDDFSEIVAINEAQLNTKVTLKGEIWSIKNIFTRYGKKLTQAIFNDGTNSINLTWFNSTYLTKSIKTGDRLQISGKLTKYNSKLSIIMPVWERIPDVSTYSTPRVYNEKSLHTGRLVPVYPETDGISSKWLRTKISQILPKVESFIKDPLPEIIKEQMLNLNDAYKKIHFPQSYKEVEEAGERLSFDEMFIIHLKTLKIKSEWASKPVVKKFSIFNFQFSKLLDSLPFKLTQAQIKVTGEIMSDLEKTQPMNRLVQGEVGSGKTVVAGIISFIAYLNGFKTLYMAPTEILAFQHYETFQKLLNPFGIEVGIYTGSKKFTQGKGASIKNQGKTKTQNNPYHLILNTNPDIIIGTHALISDKLITEDVGLIIIDEQQRFGVGQRSILRSRAKVPHFLTMTATPIPRTIALTLYGDLDLSIIDELPKGRIPVKTHVVPLKKRKDAYGFIQKRALEGEQIYLITPFIEISETMATVKAATVEYENLKKVFPKLKLGLLHGRLKSKEKEKVLNDFKGKNLDILVSTSVVEVGVDIPNATIMVIEGAERFGLAQLHQLRGRVGRGSKQSYCLLFPSTEESGIISRLKNLERISDGLKLSEIDLKIRGSGEIFGKAQSGRFDLKIASFNDQELIEKTRLAAQKILREDPTLAKYPALKVKLSSFEQVAPD